MLFYIEKNDSIDTKQQKIHLALLVNEILQVMNSESKNNQQLEEEKKKIIEQGIRFLEKAKGYSEGNAASDYGISPSEAFIYTLKAIDLKKLNKAHTLNDEINERIQILKEISSGIHSNLQVIIEFFKKIYANIELDSNKETSSMISNHWMRGSFYGRFE